MSKGHSTQGSKIPFISNLKKLACASKRDVLELATLRYMEKNVFEDFIHILHSKLLMLEKFGGGACISEWNYLLSNSSDIK